MIKLCMLLKGKINIHHFPLWKQYSEYISEITMGTATGATIPAHVISYVML